MSITRQDLFRLLSHQIANNTDSAFLLIGTDYRVQWISEAAKNLLDDKEELTGRACARALEGKVCSAVCIKEGGLPPHQEGQPFGPSCMEETSRSFRVRNSLIRTSNGEPVGLVKQIVPSSTTPEFSEKSFIAKGSWATNLAPTLSRIAQTTIPVLLVGETGTGKEVLAQKIHDLGPRSDHPFVVLDLSVVPETLVDDALFGHIRGAFTGATSDYTGKLVQAHGGTLLLDELENIPLSVQAKLLRFLETGIVERIGQARTSTVDVRILAATNVDPVELLRTGRLREDLFYRLRGLTIEIPPLRKRPEDIPPLVQTFRNTWSAQYGRPAPEFSPEIVARLVSHPFPGNIRELKHLIELCLSLTSEDRITERTLPPEVREILCNNEVRSAVSGGSRTLASSPPVLRVEEAFASVERDIIQRVLRDCHGRVSDAARSLDMSRITLWRKMKKYNLERHQTFSA